MHIEQLDEFIVLAKLLNFSSAAEALCLSQSALSKHIAAMERDLGFPLLERGRPLRLTPEGELFLRCAQTTAQVWHKELSACQNAISAPPR